MRTLPFLLCVCLFLPGLGCVEKLSLDDRACPCLAGWRCCGGGTCVPDDQMCPGCDLLCPAGEQCYGGKCSACDRNKACGTDCINCHEQGTGDRCTNGLCVCLGSSDCPLQAECQAGSCVTPQTDAGTCEGNCDGGTTDGGTTDGGATDGGATDGGLIDGGVDPTCTNNRRCGPDCQDCTGLDGNWACLGNRCGCFDPADCLPDQECQDNSCVP